MMHVCMLIRLMPSHSKGGMQDHALQLAQGLVRRGCTVTIITTAHPKGRKEERAEGLTVLYLPEASSARYSPAWWEASRRTLLEVHAKNPVDLVHSQSHAGKAFLLSGDHRRVGAPFLVSFHGTALDEAMTALMLTRKGKKSAGNLRGSGRRLLSFLWMHMAESLPIVRAADGVIVTSYEQAELLRRWHRCPQNKLHLVFNGIDADLFAPSESGRNGSPPTILAVARMIEEKGVQFLLRALPKVFEQVDAEVVLVGDGPNLAALREEAERSGVADRVRFVGAVDFEDLPQWHRGASVFVNPTLRINGYDLTILQAMATGVPVVVSRVGSVPTAVTHAQEGLLVRPGDSKALAQALVELLSDEARSEELGGNGRHKVERLFTLDKMVDATLDAYCSAGRL